MEHPLRHTLKHDALKYCNYDAVDDINVLSCVCQMDELCRERLLVLLTSEETLHLRHSDAVMVDVTVFEQAPELQPGHPEGVVWGVGVAETAVETIHGPQLCRSTQHHKLHLWIYASQSVRARNSREEIRR